MSGSARFFKQAQIQRLKRLLLFFAEAGILLLGLVFSITASFLAYRLSDGDGPTVFVFFCPLTLSVVGFFLFRRRTRQWKIQYDAANFLKYRASQRLNPRRAERLRVLSRYLTWTPCLVVCSVLPFIPEAVGIGSRLFVSRNSSVGKYRVQIPITWIYDGLQESCVAVMTAPGIGRIGFESYWRREVPLSEMSICPLPHPADEIAPNVNLEGETVLSSLSMPFGNETLTCWDLIHNNPFVGSSPTDPSIADISCTTETDDFYAHFIGWRGDTSTFYETLRKITVSGQE